METANVFDSFNAQLQTWAKKHKDELTYENLVDLTGILVTPAIASESSVLRREAEKALTRRKDDIRDLLDVLAKRLGRGKHGWTASRVSANAWILACQSALGIDVGGKMLELAAKAETLEGDAAYAALQHIAEAMEQVRRPVPEVWEMLFRALGDTGGMWQVQKREYAACAAADAYVRCGYLEEALERFGRYVGEKRQEIFHRTLVPALFRTGDTARAADLVRQVFSTNRMCDQAFRTAARSLIGPDTHEQAFAAALCLADPKDCLEILMDVLRGMGGVPPSRALLEEVLQIACQAKPDALDSDASLEEHDRRQAVVDLVRQSVEQVVTLLRAGGHLDAAGEIAAAVPKRSVREMLEWRLYGALVEDHRFLEAIALAPGGRDPAKDVGDFAKMLAKRLSTL